MRILVATDLSIRSHRALRRAGLLAQANGAGLVLAHVVSGGRPAAQVQRESREARRMLDEQIAAMPELRGLSCRPVVLAGDPASGILRIAESIDAVLVVMGAHRRQSLRYIFGATTIERVIRAAAFPVLTVSGEVERPYAETVAAVETTALCAHALGTARRLALLGGTRVTIAHAVAPPGQVMMFYAGMSRESIDAYVRSARRKAESELAAFIAGSGADLDNWSARVEAGVPIEVIERVVKARRPDLLVLGTHARSGIAKAILGSVAEEAVRALDVDVLAVPPPRTTSPESGTAAAIGRARRARVIQGGLNGAAHRIATGDRHE